MKKIKIAAFIFGILLVSSTIAYADQFSETVDYGARWNHGSVIDWNLSKACYSDLGKWGYYKEARASINGNETRTRVEKNCEWACAKQSGGWWNQLATAGYDIREYKWWD